MAKAIFYIYLLPRANADSYRDGATKPYYMALAINANEYLFLFSKSNFLIYFTKPPKLAYQITATEKSPPL